MHLFSDGGQEGDPGGAAATPGPAGVGRHQPDVVGVEFDVAGVERRKVGRRCEFFYSWFLNHSFEVLHSLAISSHFKKKGMHPMATLSTG